MSFKDYCKLIFFAVIVLIVVLIPPLAVAAILYVLEVPTLIVIIAAFGATFFSLFAGIWLVERIGSSGNI